MSGDGRRGNAKRLSYRAHPRLYIASQFFKWLFGVDRHVALEINAKFLGTQLVAGFGRI
jgi:hypothetical protein